MEPAEIDNLLSRLDDLGSIQWNEPPLGQKGPTIATSVVQYCFGRPLDQGGVQERILQLGVGNDSTRRGLYGDVSENRVKNIKECLKDF